jgi:hypothetical protein
MQKFSSYSLASNQVITLHQVKLYIWAYYVVYAIFAYDNIF